MLLILIVPFFFASFRKALDRLSFPENTVTAVVRYFVGNLSVPRKSSAPKRDPRTHSGGNSTLLVTTRYVYIYTLPNTPSEWIRTYLEDR